MGVCITLMLVMNKEIMFSSAVKLSISCGEFWRFGTMTT